MALAKAAVAELDQELDAMANSGGGMDPVLCAQAFPLDVKSHDAVITGNEAKVNVDTVWDTPSAPTIRESIQVGLIKQDGQWAISAISCKR